MKGNTWQKKKRNLLTTSSVKSHAFSPVAVCFKRDRRQPSGVLTGGAIHKGRSGSGGGEVNTEAAISAKSYAEAEAVQTEPSPGRFFFRRKT